VRLFGGQLSAGGVCVEGVTQGDVCGDLRWGIVRGYTPEASVWGESCAGVVSLGASVRGRVCPGGCAQGWVGLARGHLSGLFSVRVGRLSRSFTQWGTRGALSWAP